CEQQLLASVPGLLERLFARTHTEADTGTGLASDKAAVGQSDQSADIGQTLQNVLLAELNTRLQPLLGMIEALQTATTRPS
ncbi:MAG: DUF3348 family protein, partial [Ideonella sp.]